MNKEKKNKIHTNLLSFSATSSRGGNRLQQFTPIAPGCLRIYGGWRGTTEVCPPTHPYIWNKQQISFFNHFSYAGKTDGIQVPNSDNKVYLLWQDKLGIELCQNLASKASLPPHVGNLQWKNWNYRHKTGFPLLERAAFFWEQHAFKCFSD